MVPSIFTSEFDLCKVMMGSVCSPIYELENKFQLIMQSYFWLNWRHPWMKGQNWLSFHLSRLRKTSNLTALKQIKRVSLKMSHKVWTHLPLKLCFMTNCSSHICPLNYEKIGSRLEWPLQNWLSVHLSRLCETFQSTTVKRMSKRSTWPKLRLISWSNWPLTGIQDLL